MALRVVLTGGVCAGKSTVFRRLQSQLDVPAVYVPEPATQLFEEGQPNPDDSWDENQYVQLTRAIVRRHLKLEATGVREAKATGAVLIIQDRGLYDALAFRGGEQGVREQTGSSDRDPDRYDLVIHLESLATAQPDRFGDHGNPHRSENLARAQEGELAAREAWNFHPRRLILSGTLNLDEITSQVLEIIYHTLLTKEGSTR
jgi:nicotinamide riboside kinase